MKRRQLLLAAASFPAAAQIAAPPPPHRGHLLIRGATLHRPNSPALEAGQLWVRDGHIAAVAAAGEPLPLPAGYAELDLSGLHLYPGLVAANTQLGLTESPTQRGTIDVQELGALNPNVHAWASFNADSELIAVTRAEGVLTAEVAPVSPRGGLIAGRSSVMRLDGWSWSDMALRPMHALHLHLPPWRAATDPIGGSTPAAPTRAALQERLRLLDRALDQARAYPSGAGARDLRLEALAPYARGEAPVFVHAQELAQMRHALQLAERHKLRITLVAGPDVALLAPLLAEREIPVIVDGVMELPLRRDDPIDAAEAVPARLHEAGVRFAIARQGGARNALNLRNLAQEAAAAVAAGLPRAAALRAITQTPAELLGVGDRVGSLAVGQEASFFVTRGDALEPATSVLRVFVLGREIDTSHRQTRLMQKYR